MYFDAWMPYIVTAGFAYMAFVFSSESLNPFWTRKGPKRRRWRLARSLAAIFFVFATIGLWVEPHIGLPRLYIIIAVAALCFLFSLIPLIKYFRSNSLMTKTLPKERVSEAYSRMPITTSTAALDYSTASKPGSEARYNSTDNANLAATAPKAHDVSVSEEYQLEQELAQMNHEARFEHLDQTIAEADFLSADLTISDIQQVAQPDRSSLQNSSSLDGSNQLSDLRNKTSVNTFARNQGQIDGEVSNPNEDLLIRLDIQNEKIKNLATNNISLVNKSESLVKELTQLRLSLQKSNATARKSIAQRNEAVKMKDSALALATMERKKRQLTEIKARKALLRFKSSLKEIT